MEIARFGKSVLYEDRVVTKQGEALLQRGVTALADTAAKIAISRPGAVARLAASGAVNGRAFRSAQGYDARRFYLLVEAPELVALLPCRAGDEQAAKDFAARVNVAALNARRIEREREETLGDAQHELDAAESQQIDVARGRLEDAEADTGPVETLRETVGALSTEYDEAYEVEEAQFAELRRVEAERRAEEKRVAEERRAEEKRVEAERRAEEERLRAEAERAVEGESPDGEEKAVVAAASESEADIDAEAGIDADVGGEPDELVEPEAPAETEPESDEAAEPPAEISRETVVIMETVATNVEGGSDPPTITYGEAAGATGDAGPSADASDVEADAPRPEVDASDVEAGAERREASDRDAETRDAGTEPDDAGGETEAAEPELAGAGARARIGGLTRRVLARRSR